MLCSGSIQIPNIETRRIEQNELLSGEFVKIDYTNIVEEGIHLKNFFNFTYEMWVVSVEREKIEVIADGILQINKTPFLFAFVSLLRDAY